MRKKSDQASKRRHAIYEDQHGREYHTTVENDTGDPVGPLYPMFTAPVMADQSLLVVDPSRPGRLAIDYGAWLSALTEAHRHRMERMSRYAEATYGDRAGEMLARPTQAMVDFAGRSPLALDLVKAARAGNKWALGLTTAVPEWARPFIAAAAPVREEFPDAEEVFADAEEAVSEVADAGDEAPAQRPGYEPPPRRAGRPAR